jgi:hypothetical protein
MVEGNGSIEIEGELKSVKSAETYKINVTNDTIEIIKSISNS